MIEQLLKDAREHPWLFLWRGALNPEEVDNWSSPNHIQIPIGLKQLWIATGGGEIFETETILSPLASDPEFDIKTTNEFYWRFGVETSLLIFHVGAWLSAVRNEPPNYVVLDTVKFATRAEFKDIDA